MSSKIPVSISFSTIASFLGVVTWAVSRVVTDFYHL